MKLLSSFKSIQNCFCYTHKKRKAEKRDIRNNHKCRISELLLILLYLIGVVATLIYFQLYYLIDPSLDQNLWEVDPIIEYRF